MHNKFLLLILFLFIPNIMLGKNYMMNCISPDFKKAAFYKFDSTNNKLLMRTVKKKWKDFCDFDTENEQNINCTFNKLNIIRSSTIENEQDYLEKYLNINFTKYSLVETIKIFKNSNLKEKIDNIYKCKKINI
ncbi:MAG: hypothetical protein CBD54_004950 [Alphaproteobacteria bacterium TMED194]|nr:MAG: hypothetical protein CBD54_004950 [Alphaproteobacteria bacterium TMED194]